MTLLIRTTCGARDMASSQQNGGIWHTAWFHQLPWAEMQAHGTGQSNIVKCNLSSRSLLAQHKTAKNLSIVSKTEPSQDIFMLPLHISCISPLFSSHLSVSVSHTFPLLFFHIFSLTFLARLPSHFLVLFFPQFSILSHFQHFSFPFVSLCPSHWQPFFSLHISYSFPLYFSHISHHLSFWWHFLCHISHPSFSYSFLPFPPSHCSPFPFTLLPLPTLFSPRFLPSCSHTSHTSPLMFPTFVPSHFSKFSSQVSHTFFIMFHALFLSHFLAFFSSHISCSFLLIFPALFSPHAFLPFFTPASCSVPHISCFSNNWQMRLQIALCFSVYTEQSCNTALIKLLSSNHLNIQSHCSRAERHKVLGRMALGGPTVVLGTATSGWG